MTVHIFQNDVIANECGFMIEYICRIFDHQPYVLCLETAADILGLYSGTFETELYAYDLSECEIQGIQFQQMGDIKVTTVDQTISDILNKEDTDIQVICEMLATVYDPNYGQGYHPINLTPYGQKCLAEYQNDAIDYYKE